MVPHPSSLDKFDAWFIDLVLFILRLCVVMNCSRQLYNRIQAWSPPPPHTHTPHPLPPTKYCTVYFMATHYVLHCVLHGERRWSSCRP
jgi:hypothetical protein